MLIVRPETRPALRNVLKAALDFKNWGKPYKIKAAKATNHHSNIT